MDASVQNAQFRGWQFVHSLGSCGQHPAIGFLLLVQIIQFVDHPAGNESGMGPVLNRVLPLAGY